MDKKKFQSYQELGSLALADGEGIAVRIGNNNPSSQMLMLLGLVSQVAELKQIVEIQAKRINEFERSTRKYIPGCGAV